MSANDSQALCVDLDGTLIRSDLLLESFLALIKRNPLFLFRLPLWLLRGKAALKAEIASRVSLDPAYLPYHPTFLPWLRTQATRGRSLILCTASNHRLAEAVARHLGCFSEVIASDATHNLSGKNKAERLVARFGEKGFDYCGNAAVDLAVWRRARGAVVVEGGERLLAAAQQAAPVLARFNLPRQPVSTFFRALRPHQWAKNLLLFVPLLAAHQGRDLDVLLQSVLAFVAFGLCASSVYLLNDLLDLDADRQHPRKRYRPLASGDLPLLHGLLLMPCLLLGSGALAWLLPGAFVLVLACYYLLTVAYSFVLKRKVLLDILALAGLYTVRLVAGAFAVGVPLSFWLLLFAVFLFLSLALVKRYAELYDLRASGGLSTAGRGYHVEDLPVLQNLGTAAGYLSVLVLALYINSGDVLFLYRQPEWIWGLCGLMLFWISRVWILAHRGAMHDDPVIFAVTDRASLLVGFLAGLFVWLAI